MSEKKKNRNKNNGFSKVIYITGTAALIFMLAFSAVNFVRDARVLRLPVLTKTAAADKGEDTGESGDYQTIKYKKPAATATPKPKKNTAPKSTKAPTPTPKPKAIPSSDP